MADATFEFEPLFPVDFDDALDAVIYGTDMVKLGNWGEPHTRRFFLDKETLQELTWVTPAKADTKSRIKLKSIKSFQFGYKGKLFEKQGQQLGKVENLAFTINYLNDKEAETILSVVFKNRPQLFNFVSGLQYLVMCEKSGLILTSQYFSYENYL